MRGSEQGSPADWDWERSRGEVWDVSAKRRSRRRWSAEEKARIVRKSFWPGKRVEDVARRYGLSCKRTHPVGTAGREVRSRGPGGVGA